MNKAFYWIALMLYKGIFVSHASFLYSDNDVRIAVLGLFFLQKRLKLFDFKFFPAFTSIGIISSFSVCTRKSSSYLLLSKVW